MKYKFRINKKPYEVDLLDIHSQPIVAIVNGEVIDVWLEDEIEGTKDIKDQQYSRKVQSSIIQSLDTITDTASEIPQKTAVKSPIPGVVISVNVRIGDQVQRGQELCIIEAMKMKNTIRSPRSGKIRFVNIHIGQAVQHHDVLFEYSE